MSEILRFDKLCKSYKSQADTVEVLKGINFSLSRGEFVAITGPSGSGKSTLLNLASLLDQPTEGKIYFESQEVGGINEQQLSEIRKTSIGMVFQKYCLLPHRTVLENVIFRYRYLHHSRSSVLDKAEEALNIVGLTNIKNQPARLLSGGEMQRVSIARAVVNTPKLLVADEPTGNLDKNTAATIMDYFKTLHTMGITILFVTHNESLLRFCSRHLICSDGCLLEC